MSILDPDKTLVGRINPLKSDLNKRLLQHSPRERENYVLGKLNRQEDVDDSRVLSSVKERVRRKANTTVDVVGLLNEPEAWTINPIEASLFIEDHITEADFSNDYLKAIRKNEYSIELDNGNSTRTYEGIIPDDLSKEALESEVEETYYDLLASSFEAATVFAHNSPVEFDEEEVVERRLVDLLSETPSDGNDLSDLLSSPSESEIKESLALANHVSYEKDGTEIQDQVSDRYQFREGRTLRKTLADEVYNLLDGEARAFFELARRDPGERRAFHRKPGNLFLENRSNPHSWSIDAPPADRHDSAEEVIEQEVRPEVESQLETEIGYDVEADHYLNAVEKPVGDYEELVQAVHAAHRFHLDNRDQIRHEAIEKLETQKEKSLKYAERAHEDRQDAEVPLENDLLSNKLDESYHSTVQRIREAEEKCRQDEQALSQAIEQIRSL